MKKRVLSIMVCIAIIVGVMGCGNSSDERVPQQIPVEDNYRTYYEVFVYSYYDGNGDGIGDFKGLPKNLIILTTAT